MPGRHLALGAFLLAGAIFATNVSGNDDAAKPAPQRAVSVKDSPGYVPLVDPESTSVRLGRRPNAPLVRMPFANGANSLDHLGYAVCRALERGTRDSLMQLTVTMEEFRGIMWLEFPQSRPVTGLQWEDGWMALNARLVNGGLSAWTRYGGTPLEFVSIEKNESRPYKNFTLHNGITLTFRNADGRLEKMDWVRSVAERKGQFKIYSVKD